MNREILLVEDNASDEKLTVLAFKKCGVALDMVVVRDGARVARWPRHGVYSFPWRE